jgi:hypothetical protein
MVRRFLLAGLGCTVLLVAVMGAPARAASGLSASRSAAEAQYGGGPVGLPGTTTVPTAEEAPSSEVLGESHRGPSEREQGVRGHGPREALGAVGGARQIKGSKLPFTGHDALVVLLVGLTLTGLGAGLARLRRKIESPRPE